LRARTAEIPEGGRSALRAQLGELEALRNRDDPTIRFAGRADEPASPVFPRPVPSVAAGLLGGLVLGIGGAFLLQVLDPRLRREEQLRDLYRLPVVGRIPKTVGQGIADMTTGSRLPPPVLEAYRTLRATISASRGESDGPASLLVTSPSGSDGKTTTALNLAASFALAGKRTVFIEADLRHPKAAEALGLSADRGIGSVLLGRVALQDALIPTEPYGNFLRVLLAEDRGDTDVSLADRLFMPPAGELIERAQELADYVVIDSPPLAEVIDALPLARQASQVLVVVRLGKTHLTKLGQLGELLAHTDVWPVGFAVVGVSGPAAGDYLYGRAAGSREIPASRRRRARLAGLLLPERGPVSR
jgi:Mrp family chromosome partitioning ATPase